MIWTHLPQRSDMFAVFDVIRKVGIGKVVTETKVLKLIRGGELLEQVEFPDLQDQVRLDEERALSQHISDSDLRVLVIVKRPLLALRYMLPDGQIRKTQMNFVPLSGCDVALETLRTAGLPIRDKDLPQVQGQRPQSSQSQPKSQDRPGSLNAAQVQHPQSSHSQSREQERPGSLNAGQSVRPQSLHGAFSDCSQPVPQERTGGWNTGYGSIHPSAQPTQVNIRPTSAPSGVNQDEFSRPIAASSRPTLDTSGSATTVITVPSVAKSRNELGLLPSPVFNGTYEPFGSFQVRPVSAPEQTQIQREHTDSLSLSQMLPPERTLPFPEKKVHPFRRDEVASQEVPSQGKPVSKSKVKRQAKPRAQPAKPRKSRAKVGVRSLSSDPLAPSSPTPESHVKGKTPSSSAPPRDPVPELQVIPPSSEPLALPSINSRKRSVTDRSENQPNKRQAQTMTKTTTETLTGTMTEDLTTAVPEQQAQGQPGQATNPFINVSNHDVLDTIDNLVRKYHDLPAPKAPQTAMEHLAEFVAQSDEEMARAIDNLICECLKDESFGKLMDSVEGAWKRIGLGC
ncbi:MAG: hypothetical protein ALECFALPRED_007017 [Alectoria fallacina]|uniref:Uncharacterized protein n=1 Tax=Alectoria fallacina TaxID=1903189 RepID=A0A8H3IXI3_9LECA|nr:MAG: hypothetical protein ALECFALPRED_007017 [Alectoria fallacina]